MKGNSKWHSLRPVIRYDSNGNAVDDGGDEIKTSSGHKKRREKLGADSYRPNRAMRAPTRHAPTF